MFHVEHKGREARNVPRGTLRRSTEIRRLECTKMTRKSLSGIIHRAALERSTWNITGAERGAAHPEKESDFLRAVSFSYFLQRGPGVGHERTRQGVVFHVEHSTPYAQAPLRAVPRGTTHPTGDLTPSEAPHDRSMITDSSPYLSIMRLCPSLRAPLYRRQSVSALQTLAIKTLSRP